MDALRAYETLIAGPVTKDKVTQKQMGWAYDTMSPNTEHVYSISAGKEQRLVATMTWHRKLIKLSPARFIEEPLFNLNLKIISPAGKTVIFETPDRNNLIKTDYRLTEDGEYKIILQNPTRTGERDYGLAFQLINSSR